MKHIGEGFDAKLKAAIASLGNYTPEPEPDPACRVCNDLGYISLDVNPSDPRFGRLFPCDNPDCIAGNANRIRAWEARYKTARIPAHYRELTFDTWNQLPDDYKANKYTAMTAARFFAERPDHYFSRGELYNYLGIPDPAPGVPDRPKNCVMLFGDVGMGKTGLMAAAANRLIEQGRSLMYIRQIDAIEEIQSRYGRDEYPSAEDVLRDFKTAPLLFLDEFGAADDKPDRLQKIESIIEGRRAEYLPTFMTSNLNQAQFLKVWGQRTADRVFNMAHWIPVDGLKIRSTEAALPII